MTYCPHCRHDSASSFVFYTSVGVLVVVAFLFLLLCPAVRPPDPPTAALPLHIPTP